MDEQGLSDAAIFMISLGEDAAADVLQHMSPGEVHKLGECIVKTGQVSHDRVEEVLSKFVTQAAVQSQLIGDTGGYVRAVLKRALGPDKASMMIDRILQSDDAKGIENLKWMDPATVAELLRTEHPQIVAAALVHLEPEQSAQVLRQLDEKLRNSVMLRIATMDGIQPDALEDLNHVLQKIMANGDRLRKSLAGGVETVASLMNHLGGGMEGSVLETIREHDEALAQDIMDRMFVFDDLIKLDNKSTQMILKEVPSDTLIVALKGASAEMAEKFLSNMSSRAAETLREDIETRGAVRLSDVQAQQKEILKIARRLADEGQIAIGGSGENALV